MIAITAEKIVEFSQMIEMGAQIENPKIELKREFWDTSNEQGEQEFCKDLAAMANSPGGDGYVILGVDGRTGEIFNTPLALDPDKLRKIIIKRVQEPLNVEFYEVRINDKTIVTVAYIPRSFNKPHILKRYKSYEFYIPIRKSTSIYPADKFDLDLMYSERDQEVIPPYRLETFFSSDKIKLGQSVYTSTIYTNILNTGTRVNMVTKGCLVIIENGVEIYKLPLTSYFIPGVTQGWVDTRHEYFIKVLPNDILRVNLGFSFYHLTPVESVYLNKLRANSLRGYIKLTDVTGNSFETEEVNLEAI